MNRAIALFPEALATPLLEGLMQLELPQTPQLMEARTQELRAGHPRALPRLLMVQTSPERRVIELALRLARLVALLVRPLQESNLQTAIEQPLVEPEPRSALLKIAQEPELELAVVSLVVQPVVTTIELVRPQRAQLVAPVVPHQMCYTRKALLELPEVRG